MFGELFIGRALELEKRGELPTFQGTPEQILLLLEKGTRFDFAGEELSLEPRSLLELVEAVRVNDEWRREERNYELALTVRGAKGELEVLSALLWAIHLAGSDVSTVVFNNVQIPIQSIPERHCQLDHIVVGEGGIEIVDSKNWNQAFADVTAHADKAIRQALRHKKALTGWLGDLWADIEAGGAEIQSTICFTDGEPPHAPEDSVEFVATPELWAARRRARRTSSLERSLLNRIQLLVSRKVAARPMTFPQ